MTLRDLANDLDLDRLARRLPCASGLENCKCDGCIAAAALHLADEHLAAGRLFDATLKAEHAAHYAPRDLEVALAATRLETALQVAVRR